MPIDNTEDALDLVGVTVNGGLNALFRVVGGEPNFLAKVGALARGLEVQPTEGGVFFLGGRVGEVVGLVVGVDEVFEDGAGLVEGSV